MAELKIDCQSDYRDLRIYINDLLHFQYLKKDYLSLQTYYIGRKKRMYHIDIYLKGKTILLTYDLEDTWKKIIKILDDNI